MVSFKQYININERVIKKDGRWALVSKKSGRPLKYWDHKPSKEEISKEERRVQMFKYMGRR